MRSITPAAMRSGFIAVQYRETDFNFVSRLMEQEGIFYYFRHTKEDHILVLCDRSSHYEDSGKEVKYEYTHSGGAKQDHITHWVHQYQFVSGAFAQTDYEFEKHPPASSKHPDQALFKQKSAKGKAAELPHAADHVHSTTRPRSRLSRTPIPRRSVISRRRPSAATWRTDRAIASFQPGSEVRIQRRTGQGQGLRRKGQIRAAFGPALGQYEWRGRIPQ